MATLNSIWTIGHSTRTLNEFIDMLGSFDIATIVDVRRFPGSRKYPQFNKEALYDALSLVGIGYTHVETLGGRRRPQAHSLNTAWRHPAFQGYADYMETPEFQQGYDQLVELALKSRTAFLCSEAVWWRCHRSLISDLLKSRGWTVWHIMSVGKASQHPFTKPARIVNGTLTYEPEIQ